jgi:hypothetical protein
MSRQTSLTTSVPKGKPGQIASGDPPLKTGFVATGKTVGFGTAVAATAIPEAGVSPSLRRPETAAEITGLAFRGVAVYNPAKGEASTSPTGYDAGDPVPFCSKGSIWVLFEDTADTDLTTGVYIRYAAGTLGSTLGSFGATAVTSETALLPSTSAKWTGKKQTAGSVVIAELEINTP